MTREITEIATGILRRASRARFAYVQLAEDIFAYERALEIGWTENGTDFVTKPFFGSPDMMIAEDIGFMPLFASRMKHPTGVVERGFVNAAGLTKLQESGIGRANLSSDERIDVTFISPAKAAKALHDDRFQVDSNPPSLDFWKDVEDPASCLFRVEKVAQRFAYLGISEYYVSLNGIPLRTAISISMTQKHAAREGEYGPYDWDAMVGHLKPKIQEGEVFISQPPDKYYPAKVYWRAPLQNAYNEVWNKAKTDNIALTDALIALDILQIGQFRKEPEPEPVVEKKSKRKTKVST